MERLEQLVQSLSAGAPPIPTPKKEPVPPIDTGRRARPEPKRPAPAEATVPSGSPEVLKRWPQLLDAVKKDKIAAHAFLVMAEPVGLAGDVVTVAFKPAHKFHQEKTEQPEIRTIIERNLQEVFGQPLKLRCVQQGAAEPARAGKPEENPLVKQAKELFGDDVVEVKE